MCERGNVGTGRVRSRKRYLVTFTASKCESDHWNEITLSLNNRSMLVCLYLYPFAHGTHNLPSADRMSERIISPHFPGSDGKTALCLRDYRVYMLCLYIRTKDSGVPVCSSPKFWENICHYIPHILFTLLQCPQNRGRAVHRAVVSRYRAAEEEGSRVGCQGLALGETRCLGLCAGSGAMFHWRRYTHQHASTIKTLMSSSRVDSTEWTRMSQD